MPLNIPSIINRPAFLPEFDAWSKFSNKSIAITGANGILGKILSQKFDRNGIGYHTYQGDITVSADMNDWINAVKPDVFFHFAAIVPTNEVLANPSKAMNTNALSLLHIMDGIKVYAKDCWFFYASTSHVYQDTAQTVQIKSLSEDSQINPISLYGATKLAGENICRPLAEAYGISICIGRIFSFFHSSQSELFLIPSLCKRINEISTNEKLEVHNSDAVRDFLDAEMVVDAIMWLYAQQATGIVNIASGTGTSVQEVAENIAEGLNKKIKLTGINSNKQSILVADVELLTKFINSKHE